MMFRALPVSTHRPVAMPVRTRAVPASALAWLPLLLASLALAWLHARGDMHLADALVRLEGGAWNWRDAVLLEDVLHRGGRSASVACWLVLAAAYGWVAARGETPRWRRGTALVLLSVLLSTLLVGWIKSWSNMDCPWDLARYGGARPWVDLFGMRPAGLPHGRCFPAGHASAGYAWIALFFGARAYGVRWQRIGLAIGLGTGLVFGVAQQLRGAHFASHDVVTAIVCWLVALAVDGNMRRRAGRPGMQAYGAEAVR